MLQACWCHTRYTGSLGPPPTAPAASVPAPISGTSSARKLKMSAIVDQTLDAEIQPLTPEAVNKMYEAYKRKFGDAPSPEAEPTADQLAAVHQLLGSKATPYLDFAVYGPTTDFACCASSPSKRFH